MDREVVPRHEFQDYAFAMATSREHISLGYEARKDGDLPLALSHYSVAARILRDQGDTLAYAHCIRHMADIRQDQDDAASARPLYEEALEIYRSNLNTKLLDLANTVRPYALLLEQEGDSALAEPLWEEAMTLYASLRLDQGVMECRRHLDNLRAK